MTGKDMLQGIQNLDAELIEESEFGTFGKGKARGFGKKKLLFILAAALIMATMTAAAAITRWTATMQYGDNGGTTQQISEQVKKQAEQSGLSVAWKFKYEKAAVRDANRDEEREKGSRFRDGQRHHRHPRPDADGSVRRQSHFPH